MAWERDVVQDRTGDSDEIHAITKIPQVLWTVLYIKTNTFSPHFECKITSESLGEFEKSCPPGSPPPPPLPKKEAGEQPRSQDLFPWERGWAGEVVWVG